MNWKELKGYTNWNGEISNEVEKKEIAKKINCENIKIEAIPTSYEIKLLCAELKIRTVSIMEKKPDWSFDGTDEIDENNWLIKGRGAAMFKEKMNILNSKKVYILADKSKFVKKLGDKFYIPVECYPETINYVKERLYKLGAKSCILRAGKGKDGPIITENNNFILDTKFENIDMELEKNIKLITGVVETGLFIGYKNIEVLGL